MSEDKTSWCLGYLEGLNVMIERKKELISEFVKDLKNQPEGRSEGDQYGAINYIIDIEEHKKLIKKWEERLPDATGKEVLYYNE